MKHQYGEPWTAKLEYDNPDSDFVLATSSNVNDDPEQLAIPPIATRVGTKYADLRTPGRKRALQRAADCVNALSGLNPAGVKGMVEAAQRVLDLQFIELTHDENQTQEQFDEALAKDAAEQSKAMADLATALANLKGPQ